MPKPALFLAAAVALVLAAPLGAGEPINERRPLNGDATLSVKNLAGVIEVTAWDRKELQLTGTLGGNAEGLEITGDARQLSIETRYPRRTRGGPQDSELRLQVPAGVALELETVSADIRVSGTRGPVRASSVSGDVRLDVAAPRVDVSTVSGDLRLRAPSTRTTLASVSGDIAVRGPRGTLDAETVSGDLAIEGGPFRELKVESVSGDLMLGVSLDEGATLAAETLSGEIDLRLPAATSAALSMKTFSGELSNGFGGDGSGDRRSADYRLGAGKGRIRLNSFSGDIAVGRSESR